MKCSECESYRAFSGQHYGHCKVMGRTVSESSSECVCRNYKTVCCCCESFKRFGGEMNVMGDCSMMKRTVMQNDTCGAFCDATVFYVFSVAEPERILFSSRWEDEVQTFISETEKVTGVYDDLKYRDTLEPKEEDE